MAKIYYLISEKVKMLVETLFDILIIVIILNKYILDLNLSVNNDIKKSNKIII